MSPRARHGLTATPAVLRQVDRLWNAYWQNPGETRRVDAVIAEALKIRLVTARRVLRAYQNSKVRLAGGL